METTQNIWQLKGRSLHRQVRRAEATRHILKNRAKLVLDIGAAEGFVTSFLSDKQTYVIGIDIDESIKIAKAKVKNADFIRASITNLPFRDKCFEAITLLEVLEHLQDSILRDGIEEVDRVLKYGGILLISVPYKEKITYTRCIYCGKLTPLWGHLRSMDEEKVTSLLPDHYTLISKYTLPNIELISISPLFRRLPFKIWFTLNNMLGIFRKGYWLLLKYQKRLYL